MRRIEAVGATDRGQSRQTNEDAYHAGHSVFAVADGMGGHLAGEVASATALQPIADLDGRVFGDADDALATLRDAVVAANATVAEMAENEPSYHGMGTTLTAALVEGRRLHVAHVGDSRAYLLRGGQFSQLTDDHTLVQHLVDEGQITREEAEQHPQRSVVTRAIGVSNDIEVDSMSLDLEPGDQLLLCSDGLTGVVSDTRIAEELAGGRGLEATAHRLIDLANEAGGPDNITVILLRYETDEPTTSPAAATADGAPARANAVGGHVDEEGEPRGPTMVTISTRDEHAAADWAPRLGTYGEFSKSSRFPAPHPDEQRSAGQVLARAVAIVIGLALLVGVIVAGGRFLLSQQYYVGLAGDEVVIYQGIDASIGRFALSEVVERSGVTLDEVPPWFHSNLENGIPAADLNDARRLVANNVPRRGVEDDAATDEDGEADTADDEGAAP